MGRRHHADRRPNQQPASECPQCGIYFFNPGAALCSICRHPLETYHGVLWPHAEAYVDCTARDVPSPAKSKELNVYVKWPKYLEEGGE